MFAGFHPWELQHIDHANYFIMRLCRALVEHSAAEAAAGRGREILPSQFGNLHAHLGHLVQYLRVHQGVAKAALDHLQSGEPLSDDERVRKEFVDRYELLPLTRYWQMDRSQSVPDPILDKEEDDGLLVMGCFVGHRPGQIPFGWSDALRGRYIHWYGGALTELPWLPPWGSIGKRWAHDSFVELWRLCGFALWDRKRVEALKRLRRFETFKTGFLLDRS